VDSFDETANEGKNQETPWGLPAGFDVYAPENNPPEAPVEPYVAPAVQDLPKTGPGSPGFDVYAPENQNDYDLDGGEPAEKLEDHDDEDVQAALERSTDDGVGETDPADLPESDVPAGEELAEDYPDLQPTQDNGQGTEQSDGGSTE
jgi:hypothetical protein